MPRPAVRQGLMRDDSLNHWFRASPPTGKCDRSLASPRLTAIHRRSRPRLVCLRNRRRRRSFESGRVFSHPAIVGPTPAVRLWRLAGRPHFVPCNKMKPIHTRLHRRQRLSARMRRPSAVTGVDTTAAANIPRLRHSHPGN